MNYNLLKDKVYLTLLAFYNHKKMPSFIELGKIIGITRQTASVKVKELLNNSIISVDENGILLVNNDLDIDVSLLREYLKENNFSFNVLQMRELLFSISKVQTKTEIANELGISRSSLYTDDHIVVYGICSEGKIKYIGTTKHYQDRINQHISNKPFLNSSNFVILADNVGNHGYNLELELIHLLQPEWNKMGKN